MYEVILPIVGLTYPCISLIRAIKNKELYDKEIKEHKYESLSKIDFLAKQTKFQMPVMVGNQNVHVPVGGGSYEEWKSVGNCLTVLDGTKKHTYNLAEPTLEFNYEFEKKGDYISYYINEIDTMNTILNIHNMKNQIPITFPMKYESYSLYSPSSKKVFYIDKSLYLYDSDRQRLLRSSMFRKRLPLTFTIPVVCFGVYMFMRMG